MWRCSPEPPPRSCAHDLDFRVQGFGFRVQGFGLFEGSSCERFKVLVCFRVQGFRGL